MVSLERTVCNQQLRKLSVKTFVIISFLLHFLFVFPNIRESHKTELSYKSDLTIIKRNVNKTTENNQGLSEDKMDTNERSQR